MIVVSARGPFLVYGFIYEHYFRVTPTLGLPIVAQAPAPGGGLFQAFEGGDIYFRSDTGAASVRRGQSGGAGSRWEGPPACSVSPSPTRSR